MSDDIIVWDMSGEHPSWTFKHGNFTILAERRPLGTWRVQLTEGDHLHVEHFLPNKEETARTLASLIRQIDDGTKPYKSSE